MYAGTFLFVIRIVRSASGEFGMTAGTGLMILFD